MSTDEATRLSPPDLLREVVQEAERSTLACPCGWLAPHHFKGTASLTVDGDGKATFVARKITYEFCCPVCGAHFTGTCDVAGVSRGR